MPDDYVNAAEAARLLGQHEKIIRQWIHEKKIRATHPGRDYRIPMSEIQRLQKAAPPAAPTADPLVALENRLHRYVDQQIAALEQRLATQQKPRAETPPVRAPEARRTASSARPVSEDPSTRPSRDKPFRTHEEARGWLEVHYITRLTSQPWWREIPLESRSRVIAFARLQGAPPRWCESEGCICRDLID